MGDFRKCIEGAVRAGKLKREHADELIRRQNEQRNRLDPIGTSDDAAVAAAQHALEQLEFENALAKRQRALQIIATSERLADAGSHADGFISGVFSLLGRDIKGRAAYSNIESR